MGALPIWPTLKTESTRPRKAGAADSWTIERARVEVTPILRPQETVATTSSHQLGSIHSSIRITRRESCMSRNSRPG